MLIKSRRAAVIAAGLAVVSGAAIAAGSWQGWPIVGNPSYCAAIVGSGPTQGGITGQGAGSVGGSTICAQTVPAGPTALTDEELIPADVNSGNGGTPTQSVLIPSGMLGGLNLKVNRLVGGDFGTNLWQRGTTPLSGASPTVANMSADRWWAIAASNVVTISKQTPASSAADYLGNIGLNSWMRVARPSGTPSGVTCVGQTLEQQAAAPLIGNNAVFSFYGYAPTTFSASNFQITVTVAYFTAADAAGTQAAIGNAGANSSTFALSASGQAGGIAGYQAATAGFSPGTSGTLANNVATIALSTTPTRYSVYAPIPAATAAGTQVTSVGVAICATPTFTTTVSTDYFEITGAQLQAMPSAVTSSMPAGLVSPTGFERRSAAIEQANQLYYSYVLNESITAVFSRGLCVVSTTSIANCFLPYPEPMRIAPVAKYTAGFQMCTTGACSAQTACTALSTSATLAFTISNSSVVVDCASSAAFSATAGVSGFLVDKGSAGGAGVISISAEP